MKLRSVVWVALVAIALAGTSIVGLANPMTALPGFDDVPYFSTITGVPRTHFLIGEKVYVAYFESATTCFNDHVNAPDEMGVAVDSQSTEPCGPPLNSGTVIDGPDVTDPPPCGPVGGNSGPNEANPDTLAAGSPNVAYLALQEITPGLPFDGIGGPNGANNSGFFIGDISTTPVTVLAGDKLVVGLSANNQDTAYVEAVVTGGAYGWYDSVSNVDPGTRGYGPGPTIPAAPGPGDGAYGIGDEMVWEVTIHGYCGGGAPPFWYYRVNGGGWIGIAPVVVGGAYPTWRLGYTPPIAGPGSVVHGSLVEYLYDPTGTPVLGATPIFGDTIIDQPVDLADATYDTIPGPAVPTVAPDDGSTGFQDEYMTIGTANANVGGASWWIGVYDAYDSGFEPAWPLVFTADTLTVIAGSAPVITGGGAGWVLNITGTANNFTLDGMDVRGGPANTTIVQISGGPAGVTIRNGALSNVNALDGIVCATGGAGANSFSVLNNVITTKNGSSSGLYIESTCNTLLVDGNTFNRGSGNPKAINIMPDCASTGSTFTDNTFNQAHVLVGTPGRTVVMNNVLFERNTFNTSYLTVGWGGGNANTITNFRVRGNVFQGNMQGLEINTTALQYGTAMADYNVFNTWPTDPGVKNWPAGGATLDAEHNWWNSTTGPNGVDDDGAVPTAVAFRNQDGAGDQSRGSVDYRPWLNGVPEAGVGANLANNNNPAVQGNKTVEANSWYWTINQALVATNAPACGVAPCRNVTIDVAPGTYAEEIVFGYTNIAGTTLRATGGKAVTNIEAGADTTIIDVTNAPQSLQLGDGGTPDIGFTIYFDAAAVPAPSANKIDHAGSVLSIFDCDVLGTTGTGIFVNSASAGGRIVRTLIDDCDTSGIWLHLVGGANFDIDDCTITNGGIGIDIDSGANTITNCLIQFNTNHGIDLMSNGNIVGGSGNTIRNNAQNGLQIVGNNTVVTGNTIHNNGDRGIDITGNNNTFNNNQVSSNAAQGVILRGASTGNVFNTDDSAANTNCIWDNDSDGSNNNEQMRNQNTATTVDATHNYWGSASGPFNAMNNPSGDMTNRITDFIDATPFALTCGGGTADATVSLNCGAGWYLTSVPLVPGDPVAENVYSSLPVFAAYKYNPTTTAYDDLTGQNIGWDDGYWLWLMGNETITVYGGEVTTDQTYALGATGWQQFSVPSVDIPVQPGMLGGTYPVPAGAPDILFSGDGGATWLTYVDAYLNGPDGTPGNGDEWIKEGIYRWDPCAGTEGAYVMMSQQNAVLDPWLGYWIETLVPGVQVQIPVAYWVANPWTAPKRMLPMAKSVSLASGDTPPAPPAVPMNLVIALDEETGVVVLNEPNPIRDVNTTTFRAMAADPIDAILVQIFSQNGALVFEEEQFGDELVWHTENEYGEYLANGVYLYRVTVRINGRWILTDVRTLVIYR